MHWQKGINRFEFYKDPRIDNEVGAKARIKTPRPVMQWYGRLARISDTSMPEFFLQAGAIGTFQQTRSHFFVKVE